MVVRFELRGEPGYEGSEGFVEEAGSFGCVGFGARVDGGEGFWDAGREEGEESSLVEFGRVEGRWKLGEQRSGEEGG